MRTIGVSGETESGNSMRRLIVILFMLALTACTAMLIGGAESDQGQKSCEEYPDQAHCE
jgi:multisubunit Na+/H+ antiporter MnhG subunit